MNESRIISMTDTSDEDVWAHNHLHCSGANYSLAWTTAGNEVQGYVVVVC